MYYNLPFNTLRDMCRTTIESLEKWLRRLIDEELRNPLGDNYLWYQDKKNNFLFKKSIRENVKKRREDEPKRYPRDIDAVLLDDAVDIILHPIFYREYFREALTGAFPDGVEEARTFFSRIIEPRNYLSHANSISIRQVEQVICYSNDIIDSLKKYYEQKGMMQLYNVPTFIQLTDSKGNTFYTSQIDNNRNGTGGAGLNLQKRGYELYPGETLQIEIEVDPSFKEEEYIINWIYTSVNPAPTKSGKKFNLTLDNSHVREDFTVYCKITSIGRDWHRLGDCDDRLSITYRVLPPVEL
ncbi:hypothetical protein WAX74_14955 [Psychrobacillus sp. FJAT-51614]|uniref:Swt1-like HEPN domain-containing protein n=1 Tax=Psychrobacillus mangrovi TaxID=3117745 RepID=A0ABU8F9L0_9BACI